MSWQAFDRLFAVNVRAPYFIIQLAPPLMGDGGRITNIGSGAPGSRSPCIR
ncbi:hypothetical protein [Streptomyces lonegramiae]|uniref:Short chain dehydrogenase n=1 Tax=Streptomyces lonegramiae TaxID=3075524 RepID=A0ABU2XLD9_9ACTN|nr:hypothetical protein [Streptomyces sp. DSM 41529]MDT0545698.1 hypothetical protein [Streptomyces sp. DSM 41529]